jgi:hypothetical protein
VRIYADKLLEQAGEEPFSTEKIVAFNLSSFPDFADEDEQMIMQAQFKSALGQIESKLELCKAQYAAFLGTVAQGFLPLAGDASLLIEVAPGIEINRLTDIVIFQQLGKEHMHRIVDLELAKVTKRLADLEVSLEITPAARDYLVEHGWDEKYGARPLRRAVERHLEDPLAEILLRGELRKGEPVQVGASPEGLTFTQPEPPKEAVAKDASKDGPKDPPKDKPKRQPRAPKDPEA